ncbi:MAG: type II toxin-antitoxin system Phd/YefM family antitoxin [Clostridia bacterium]|nr:type II toxin-antitoxin system Phd/YefM family antitoxin [Clostridia bacterium]
MLTISVSNLRKNIYNVITQTIKFNEPVHVNTKEGNAVIISEDDYNSLIETLYISSIPGMKESLLEAKNAPDHDFVNADEVEW